MTNRKFFTKNRIKRYWAEHSFAGFSLIPKEYNISSFPKFDSVQEFMEDDYCFNCGFLCNTEKCHIDALCDGGCDDVKNIILLCPICHKLFEGIKKEFFWKSFFSSGIHDVFKIMNIKYKVLDE